jgi:RecB family exonuclease
VFQKLLAAEVEKTGVAPADFRAGGRASKAWPDKENREWWLEHGPKMLQSWIAWRNGSGWQLWVTPEGTPAVELSVEYTVGDSEIKMFIDRVMVTPNGELVILDLKTGSRTPSSDLQLAVYAAGIEKQFGIRPSYGVYWMAREGVTSALSSLDYLPAERVDAIVKTFDLARNSGIFLPNTTNCFYCSVANYCEWSKK